MRSYERADRNSPVLQVGGTYAITVGEESTQVTLESVIYGEGFFMGQPGGGQPGQRQETANYRTGLTVALLP